MATLTDHSDPARTLRGWAQAYRDGPVEYRFPSDPHAEFFPRDMDWGAAEIERLQAEIIKWKREAGKYAAGCELCAPRDAENERLRAREDRLLRLAIDATWGEALEDGSVPATKKQDWIIAYALRALEQNADGRKE